MTKGESTTLSRNVVMTNGTNFNLQSNASKTTNNDKLVILTFGDTIKKSNYNCKADIRSVWI
jgi:hypothetical protein